MRAASAAILVAHIVAIAAFLYASIFATSPLLIILTVVISTTVLVQWVVIGRCILNFFENPDPRAEGRSPMVEWISEQTGVSHDTVGAWWVMLVIYLPTLYSLFKLYKLHRHKQPARK